MINCIPALYFFAKLTSLLLKLPWFENQSSQTSTHLCCFPLPPKHQIGFNSPSARKPQRLDFNHPSAAQFPLTPKGEGCNPEAEAPLYQPLSNTNVNSTLLCSLISMRKANTGNQACAGFGAKGATSFSTTKTGFALRITALSRSTKSYSEGGVFFFPFLLLSVK